MVKGTRLSVDFLLDLLTQGWTPSDLFANCPQLSPESLCAVFAFSAEVLRDEALYPVPLGVV